MFDKPRKTIQDRYTVTNSTVNYLCEDLDLNVMDMNVTFKAKQSISKDDYSVNPTNQTYETSNWQFIDYLKANTG